MTDPDRSFDENVYDLNGILHPGSVFDHPRDVLADTTLSRAEKRAILASWASDAAALTSCPSLRATRSKTDSLPRRDPRGAVEPGPLAEESARWKAGAAEVHRTDITGGLVGRHSGNVRNRTESQVAIPVGRPAPSAPMLSNDRVSSSRWLLLLSEIG